MTTEQQPAPDPTAKPNWLSLDQQLALRSAAARLAQQFEGTFGSETIERFLTTSYEQFAGRATAVNFLPVMAERFAKQRLQFREILALTLLALARDRAQMRDLVARFLDRHVGVSNKPGMRQGKALRGRRVGT